MFKEFKFLNNHLLKIIQNFILNNHINHLKINIIVINNNFNLSLNQNQIKNLVPNHLFSISFILFVFFFIYCLQNITCNNYIYYQIKNFIIKNNFFNLY